MKKGLLKNLSKKISNCSPVLKRNERKKLKEIEKEKEKFLLAFNEEMFGFGLYNKFNLTYELDLAEVTDYGYKGTIKPVPGLGFDKLKAIQENLEVNLHSYIQFDYELSKKTSDIIFITKGFCFNKKFSCPHIKPNEIFLGYNYTTDNIKVDCNKHCMFLIAGATGAGKTRFLYCVLLAWITSCSEDEVHLYLSDVAKNEFNVFKNDKHVKGYAETIEELKEMCLEIQDKIEERKKLLDPYRAHTLATNINEYNKLINEYNKTSNEKIEKLPYIYINLDEFSAIVEDKTDTEEIKSCKELIMDILKDIAKIGRSIGIFCIISTQKTTKEEIPPILKNMSAVRISFRANDAISSQVILGDDKATKLRDRLGLYSLTGGNDQEYLISPLLDIEDITPLLGKKKLTQKEIDQLIKTIYSEQKKSLNSSPKKHNKLLVSNTSKSGKKTPDNNKNKSNANKIYEDINKDWNTKKSKNNCRDLFDHVTPREKQVVKGLNYKIERNDLLKDVTAEVEQKKIQAKKEAAKTKKTTTEKPRTNGWYQLELKEKIKKH